MNCKLGKEPGSQKGLVKIKHTPGKLCESLRSSLKQFMSPSGKSQKKTFNYLCSFAKCDVRSRRWPELVEKEGGEWLLKCEAGLQTVQGDAKGMKVSKYFSNYQRGVM